MNAALAHDNRTKLADIQSTETAAAKHVNAATGLAEAMVESIQQDLKLFEAMMAVDALELKYKASGSVNESTIVALREGALDRIKTAIVTALKWLVSKLKAAKDAVVKFIHEKLDADYRMMNKYKDKIINNAEKCIGVEIWMTHTMGRDGYDKFPLPFEIGEALANYKEDKDEAIIFYTNQQKSYIDKCIALRIKNGNPNIHMKQFDDKASVSSVDDVKFYVNAFMGLKKKVDSYEKEYSSFLKKLDAQAASIERKPLGIDPDDASKVVSMLAAYKSYAIMYCDTYRAIFIHELNQYRKLMHIFIGAVNSVEESMLNLFTEMDEAEFYDDLSNTYNDEDVDPATEAPQTADDTVIAAASDPESVIDDDELHVEQVILY